MERRTFGGLGLLVALVFAASFLSSTDEPVAATATPERRVVQEATVAPSRLKSIELTQVEEAATEGEQPLLTLTEVEQTQPATVEAPTLAMPTPLPLTVVNNRANLRGGPGTDYPVVGGVAAGEVINVVAANAAGDWVQLDSGAWIALFLVDNVTGVLPVVQNIPAPPAPATATPVPVVVQQPAQPTNCDPSYPDFCLPPGSPDLDCADVSHRRFRVYQPDPHGFDRDQDGIGCESG